MNLITLILCIAMAFGFSDFLTERSPRLQRDIYYVAFGVVAFLFTIKYYYGPDILSYVPFYEKIPPIGQILAHPDKIPYTFEPGFAIFCRILKDWGVSFYWMTAIVSLFYFGVIALLFKNIDRKRSFALAILVVLDYKCIFATYRQCLSVACFVLFVLCLRDRRYIGAVVCALLTAAFHKSGAFVVAVVLFYYMVRSRMVQPYLYQLLLVVLVLVFLLPIANVSTPFVSHLPLPASFRDSIIHHLGLGRQVQVVFLIYAATLVCITHFTQHSHTRAESIAATALVGLAMVVVLYQYYYLLVRLRSYFLPIVIVYLFRTIQTSEDSGQHIPYGQLIKQAASLLVFVYLAHSAYSFHAGTLQLKNNVYNDCTVFCLSGKKVTDVRTAQLRLAERYWKEDFMKNEQNKIKH
ncbi:MAG: EpsG family protein [Paludibacteraceae bacterium]|nr:EpsG family protein [Paludibacteraceae bacterium]